MAIKLNMTSNKNEISYSYLFFTFLKIGSLAFGGFMALVSVIQDKLVEKDKVLENEIILDGISLAAILPGPLAVNTVAYIGYQLKGLYGALISMFAVILPSFILVLFFSIFYFLYEDNSIIDGILKGILPAVSAIIISVVANMIKKQIKDRRQIVIMLVSAVLLLFIGGFFMTLVIIFISGIVGFFLFKEEENSLKKDQISQQAIYHQLKDVIKSWLSFILMGFISLILLVYFTYFSSIDYLSIIGKLGLTFSGVSLSLFGGGYVMIPLLQELVVEQIQWLTKTEFANAIAIGQVTPGPILISATFIGYKVAGIGGAIIATVGIFLPPGLLMILCSELLKSIKNLKATEAVYRGIRPAVIGLIAVAAYTIGQSAEMHIASVVIFILALFLLLKYKLSVLYLIPGSAILGLILYNIDQIIEFIN